MNATHPKNPDNDTVTIAIMRALIRPKLSENHPKKYDPTNIPSIYIALYISRIYALKICSLVYLGKGYVAQGWE